MDAADAEEYTQALGQVMSGGWRQILLGQRLGVPPALGMSTQDWVRERLGGYVRLSVDERREAVQELLEGGLTTREAADVLGVSHPTVVRDSSGSSEPKPGTKPSRNGSDEPAHPALAESYPFMQGPHWKQYHVLQAREYLNKLPEEERPEAVALVEKVVASPQTIAETLGKLAAKPSAERAEIYQLHASSDSRERSLALTKAAELPPMPDPRWSAIREMERTIKGWLKQFPDDPLNPRLRDALALLGEVEREL